MGDSIIGLMNGFADLLNFWSLFYCLIGVLFGAVVGILPGLGPSAGMAILLPIAFTLAPANALIMLCGIYYGSMYSGSITAVLLNIPGESSAVFSALEGYPLTRKGQGGMALGVGIYSSFIAGTLSVVALTFFAPILARFALKFGPTEKFSLLFLAFIFIVTLSSQSLSKNFISMFLGLLVATIGTDTITGTARFTFDTLALLDGIDFVPALLGCFAICELMNTAAEVYNPEMNRKINKTEIGRVMPTLREMWKLGPSILRGGILGFIIGVLPGAGATPSVFISYGVEKKFSKYPEQFGNGSLEAIASTEAANNTASSGAMVPLLSLAIPGSGSTAVLLSGFLMFGLQPGPQLFERHPEIAWPLIASMYAGNVMLFLVCMVSIPFFIWLLQKSTPYLTPIIVAVCFAGVYSINSWNKDIWVMLICALIGFLLIIFEIPVMPALLGIILGSMMEGNFINAVTLSGGDFLVFFTRPISAFLMLLSFLIVFSSAFYKMIQRKKNSNKAIG